jgi:glycerophosphoryl diester phosphodiesterase
MSSLRQQRRLRALASHTHASAAQEAAQSGRIVRVCAHRGCSISHPENTLPALRAAVALGCEQVEYDVRMSADGVVVLLHDETVDRTTSGSGFVWELPMPSFQRWTRAAGGPISQGWASLRSKRSWR